MRTLIFIYSFFLVACSSGSGSSSGSGVSSPAPVVSSSSGATKTLTLSWTASSGTPSGYYVEQSTDGSRFSMIKQVSASASPSVVIPNLTVGQTYFYRVSAYNAGGVSAYSDTFVIQP